MSKLESQALPGIEDLINKGFPVEPVRVGKEPVRAKTSRGKGVSLDTILNPLTGLFIGSVGLGLGYIGFISFQETITQWGVSKGAGIIGIIVTLTIYLGLSASEFRLAPKGFSPDEVIAYAKRETTRFSLWVFIVALDVYGVSGGVLSMLKGKSIAGYKFNVADPLTLLIGFTLSFIIAFGAEPFINSAIKFFKER